VGVLGRDAAVVARLRANADPGAAMPNPTPHPLVVAAWLRHRAALERIRDNGTLGPAAVAQITGLPKGLAQSLYAALRNRAAWLCPDLQVPDVPASAVHVLESETDGVDEHNEAEHRRFLAGWAEAISAEGDELARKEAELARRRDRYQARDHATILSEQAKDREIAKLKREVEHLAHELSEAGTRAEVMEALARPVPKIKGPSQRGGRHEAAAVIVASDWHVEASVLPETVNYLNAYDEQIARLRCNRFIHGAQSLIEVHRSKAEIRTVVLGVIGDVIEGWIHEELMATNWCAPLEAVRFAKELLIHTIDSLLEDDQIEHLSVPCQIGNHGRLTVKRAPGVAIPTSLEWLLYVQLSEHYAKNERVAIGVPSGLVTYTEVWDYTLRWEHGDSFRSQGGIGGLTIPLNKLLARRDQDRPADMTHLGHWHTYTPSMRSVINGSLKGYDPYALSMGLPFERAAQAFYVLDRANGPHSFAPLWVQRKDDVFGAQVAA
jgi:hypothetical protein